MLLDPSTVEQMGDAIRMVAGSSSAGEQKDGLVELLGAVMEGLKLQSPADVAYEGERGNDPALVERLQSVLGIIVTHVFTDWWTTTEPMVSRVCDVTELRAQLEQIQSRIRQLQTSGEEMRQAAEEIARQMEAERKEIARKAEMEKRENAALLKRKQQLHDAKERLAALQSDIKELKALQRKLSESAVKPSFEKALGAGRDALAAFEASLETIARHAQGHREVCETLLKTDCDIVAAMSNVEERAQSADLREAGRLADDADRAFSTYRESIVRLEKSLGDYLSARDRNEGEHE